MRYETDPSGMTGQWETTKMNATTQTVAKSDISLLPIVFAALAGLMLLFASGYAQASVLHDAAHDQRHAMAFPCH